MQARKKAGKNSSWIAALLLTLPAISAAQQVAVGEYPLPAANTGAFGITAGPDAALWFTQPTKIGRITTTGVITEYPCCTSTGVPQAITLGPDGALWFTLASGSGSIGRITVAGEITEYPVPMIKTFSADPQFITAGPDGALWFTEALGIGRITTAGAITQYIVTDANDFLQGIATGQDGALWFAETYDNEIGRFRAGVAKYRVPSANSFPQEITAGPDGALWFTESNANKIGRITTAGVITEYFVPTANSAPEGITTGPDGAVWFTEYSANQIGRITTTGAITEYPVPTANSLPAGIAMGPDGMLWFAEAKGNKIGQIVFVTAGLTVSPTSGHFGTILTFTGSAFAPGESVKIYVRGIGSAVEASATADASGAFTVTGQQTPLPYGPHLFLGLGQSSGKLGAASLSVVAGLSLKPNSGAAGSSATVGGSGYGPFEQVFIRWNSPRVHLGTATTDAYGGFSGITFTVPTGAAPGSNLVFGQGETTQAIGRGAFTVQ